ncbi:aldo/keto reductase [Jidongwangia harbinensis]|uniref:aldo/keto reductase n=1 Tax=Jidongwangia harbinensis TaxID=2878561 RepID=UPI001CD991D3|nr:aldo/keto reductase [Jidongwangia harbinensis]MCA2215718.1 aldo/keto reductase [Jidongwangia harbinensis]
MRSGPAPGGTYLLGDLTVNRIGLGAKRLGRDRDRAAALLRRAVDSGINHIDTAAFYPTYAEPGHEEHDFAALGWANDVIRRALAPYPADLVIATKVGPTPDGLARPDQLRGQVEANLRALGRDHLDLVYLRQHGLDSIAEHFGALAELRQAGLIRHLGISNVRPSHLAEAETIAPVVALQNRYGIDFGRVNDEILRACHARNIAFVPFFALAGPGRERGGVSESDAVVAFARSAGVSPAQARIAWTLSRGPHVLAIPGTSSAAHLAENLQAGDLLRLPGIGALGTGDSGE